MSVTTGIRTLTTFGAGIAAALIALFLFQAMTADAVSSDEATFVPVTPCRLMDTRPDSQVGPRNSPLGPNDEYSLQVTGTEGECNVPAAATAVSLNLTGVAPTQDTFLSLYPDDAVNPGTSVVNMVAGQFAVPNKVDVKLGPSGKLVVFNRFGAIDVVGDVLGYYRHDGLADLEARILELEAGSGTSVLDRLAGLEAENAELHALTASMSLQTVDSQPTLRFTGVNVQVVNGTGSTDSENASGNLIVGYNEKVNEARTGSHNIVVGSRHSYTSHGGLVAGQDNNITGPFASVTGGQLNTASAGLSSVTGGQINEASGILSSVSGGVDNTASAGFSSVSGGQSNTASGQGSSVSGGGANVASGFYSSVTGGQSNVASNNFASVSGGDDNTASGSRSTVTGGIGGNAEGTNSSVSGGFQRTATLSDDWAGGHLYSDG